MINNFQRCSFIQSQKESNGQRNIETSTIRTSHAKKGKKNGICFSVSLDKCSILNIMALAIKKNLNENMIFESKYLLQKQLFMYLISFFKKKSIEFDIYIRVLVHAKIFQYKPKRHQQNVNMITVFH